MPAQPWALRTKHLWRLGKVRIPYSLSEPPPVDSLETKVNWLPTQVIREVASKRTRPSHQYADVLFPIASRTINHANIKAVAKRPNRPIFRARFQSITELAPLHYDILLSLFSRASEGKNGGKGQCARTRRTCLVSVPSVLVELKAIRCEKNAEQCQEDDGADSKGSHVDTFNPSASL